MGLCHFLLLHNYATCNITPLPLLKIAQIPAEKSAQFDAQNLVVSEKSRTFVL